MKKISILGSTGSIGTQTCDILREFPERFSLVGLTAGKNIELLKEQLLEFKPKFVSIARESDVNNLERFIKHNNLNTEVYFGDEGLETISTQKVDLLVVAIVGTASLWPTYRAIENKNPIALACKEVLVSAGNIITELAKEHNVPILPIDSEHAALKQCLASVDEDMSQVSKLILTASGGPFWNTPKETFESITPEKALKHPNWDMGAKITIDSATLMNKGLEVIEAHHFYNTPYDNIEVIIHPQSIIHSLVEFTDGTMLSQMGLPDMRFPIQYALTYPEKLDNPWPKTNLASSSPLEFFDPDYDKFPLLKAAFDCGRLGDFSCAVLNAANEAAVHLFLNKKIGFTDIFKTVLNAVEEAEQNTLPTIEDIIHIDAEIKSKLSYEYI
jgi:1-deoxy-D-xylulose-5-phosphate reductoisomerase